MGQPRKHGPSAMLDHVQRARDAVTATTALHAGGSWARATPRGHAFYSKRRGGPSGGAMTQKVAGVEHGDELRRRLRMVYGVTAT